MISIGLRIIWEFRLYIPVWIKWDSPVLRVSVISLLCGQQFSSFCTSVDTHEWVSNVGVVGHFLSCSAVQFRCDEKRVLQLWAAGV